MNPSEPVIETERIYRSMDEIKRVYPDQWVVLVDWTFPDMHLTGGVVVAHSPSRKALSPIIRSLRDRGVFWTGKKRHPFHHVEILDDVDRAV